MLHRRSLVLAPFLLAVLAGCETATKPADTDDAANRGGGQGSGPGSEQDFRTNVGDRVFFSFDGYDLSPEARATLTKQAAWLRQYAQYRITIEGHCDERGTREYNLALGERRAISVKSFLVAQGLPAARIETLSYGKERPEVIGSDESAWARNRRGVTVLRR